MNNDYEFELLKNYPGMDLPLGAVFIYSKAHDCYYTVINGSENYYTKWNHEYFNKYPEFFLKI